MSSPVGGTLLVLECGDESPHSKKDAASPVFLDIAGAPIPEEVHGRSLLPLFGRRAPRRLEKVLVDTGSISATILPERST